MIITLALSILGGLVALVVLAAMLWRKVVPTNYVHIVQSAKKTTSYGKGNEAGNTYYAWPSWIPVIGVTVIQLPMSVFSIELTDYEAYDNGRLPFVLDVKAFFRVKDANQAAQAIVDIDELEGQLAAILQGAVRSILASVTIEQIMADRSSFGDKFTAEVDSQLKDWGVTTVKSIELMDIRDSDSSKVIAQIMEKKKSLIDKESRVEVAANRREAELAEIAAKQEVQLRQQEAAQKVGQRAAETERQVGLAKEQTEQEVQTAAAVTAERRAATARVETVKRAEIDKERAIIKAEEEARTSVVAAQAQAETTKVKAQGELEATQLAAKGVEATGAAEAEAKKLLELAPIQAQIVLAQEIGNNSGYQQYLINLRTVEANERVGLAQAETLAEADIKVLVNGTDAGSALSGIGGLISGKGGAQMGTMLESLANTPVGKAVLDKLTAPSAS